MENKSKQTNLQKGSHENVIFCCACEQSLFHRFRCELEIHLFLKFISFRYFKMAESTFQPEVLKVRLRQINSSQNSIQTMSMWIAHHHSSIGKIAEIWASEICSNTRGNSNWVLAMFYLANDIIQNSRKTKTSPVVKEFFPALKTAVG